MSGDRKVQDWKEQVRKSGPLREVNPDKGVDGWSSPVGDVFSVRGADYFSKRQKIPSGEWMMKPLGMDWLRSSARLDHVLARPDNRAMATLRRAQGEGRALKAFVFAVNLQVPGREQQHSAVFYYATEDPIPPGSLLYRFVHGDDAFRNSRFKLLNRIVKGPWIVRATVGNHAACLMGKALTCRYHRGDNYLEIDVDIGSSALASAIVHLALGYVTSVSVDIAFMVESQSDEELPERLLGAIRIHQIEMSSALYVDPSPINNADKTLGGGGFERRKRGRGLRGHGSGKVEDEEHLPTY